jgi:hypothetical protein
MQPQCGPDNGMVKDFSGASELRASVMITDLNELNGLTETGYLRPE